MPREEQEQKTKNPKIMEKFCWDKFLKGDITGCNKLPMKVWPPLFRSPTRNRSRKLRIGKFWRNSVEIRSWKVTIGCRCFLCVLRGRNLAPFPVEFRWRFPNFEEKYPIFNFFFALRFSLSSHTSYMVPFSFKLMAIICVIVNLFFIDIIVHYNNFQI